MGCDTVGEREQKKTGDIHTIGKPKTHITSIRIIKPREAFFPRVGYVTTLRGTLVIFRFIANGIGASEFPVNI